MTDKSLNEFNSAPMLTKELAEEIYLQGQENIEKLKKTLAMLDKELKNENL